ncbi:MAG: DUF3488 and transglutaminase-like domain-containing protein [Buchananella hordeovulneris]|nr:DUF3488 and transglutaminase-like domain-containing protein [Buchananella hordeovulneris]
MSWRKQVPSLAVLTVCLLGAGLTHGPVFGDASGYVAMVAGVVLGLAVALASWRLHWGAWLTTAVTFLVYIVFGGAVALPTTTVAGVIPTVQTVRELVASIATVWMDMLTVSTPVSIFVGPLVLPFLTSLVCTVAAISAALRLRRPQWAALPVFVLLLVGILWGSQAAPLAVPVGAGVGVALLAWVAWVGREAAKDTGVGTVRFTSGDSAKRGQAIRAAALLTVCAATGVAASATVLAGTDRVVLRDGVQAPLDLRMFHSPIAPLRALTTDRAEEPLFKISGVPGGVPVRLAALDYYDGTVFQLSPEGSTTAFHRIGQKVERPEGAPTEVFTAHVEVLGYSGNWIPGGGDVVRLRYAGPNATDLEYSTYYASSLGTLLSKHPLATGDSYDVSLAVPRKWEDSELADVPFAGIADEDDQVPPVVAETAAELMGGASTGVEKVRALTKALSTKGFFGDGSGYPSLPGHRAARLERFLTEEIMVGDDDQYAPAMALMLRSQGIPARVAVGFIPAGSGTEHVVKGIDMRAWVEVNFAGAGWVPFFPTPPRDQVPPDEQPEILPNPRPQVVQPPEPAELPPDVLDDEAEDKPKPPFHVPWPVVGAAGGGLLLLAPLATILTLKALRRSRRRKRGSAGDQTLGAWEELLDRAADHAVTVDGGRPRPAQADELIALLHSDSPAGGRAGKAAGGNVGQIRKWPKWRQPSEVVQQVKRRHGRGSTAPFRPHGAQLEQAMRMAQLADQAAFSPESVTKTERDHAWELAAAVIGGMNKAPGSRRPLLAKLSLASLRRKDLYREAAKAEAGRAAREERKRARRAAEAAPGPALENFAPASSGKPGADHPAEAPPAADSMSAQVGEE